MEAPGLNYIFDSCAMFRFSWKENREEHELGFSVNDG